MLTSRSRFVFLSITHALFLLFGLSTLGNHANLKAAAAHSPEMNKTTSLLLTNPADTTNVTVSNWLSQTIDEIGIWGDPTSIALDSQNYPHIGYFNTNNEDLMYAYWDGASWITETIDSNGNSCCDLYLAIDSNDYPHLSYWLMFSTSDRVE